MFTSLVHLNQINTHIQFVDVNYNNKVFKNQTYYFNVIISYGKSFAGSYTLFLIIFLTHFYFKSQTETCISTNISYAPK